MLPAKTETQGKAVAEYDVPTSTYDSGLTYDAAPMPQLLKRMKKIKVKLLLFKKSDADLLVFAQQHETAMTGNANFTTPLPAVTEFTPVRAAYATALAAFNTAQAAARLATTNKDTARLALESALTQRGNYVEITAANAPDPVAVVESAAFAVRSDKTPSILPAPVANLSLTAGDNAGELDLQWDPVDGAATYDVHISPDPITATSWVSQPDASKSKAVVLGLPSGTKAWARVRGVGPGGTGAWSEPVSKIVP